MLCKNEEELEAAIRAAIKESLKNEVYRLVRDVERSHIETDVYGVYNPKVYISRGDDGGLIADENIIKNDVDTNSLTLIVSNITKPNPEARDKELVSTDKNLPELIEYGDGYNGNVYDFVLEGAEYLEPRPFTKNTIEDLSETREHEQALKEGLIKRGIEVV